MKKVSSLPPSGDPTSLVTPLRKPRKFKFNLSIIALLILVTGYIVSVFNYIHVSRTIAGDGSGPGAQRIVRVAHWQLEPGYREAIDWAIEEYNSLPHVREANVVVHQMGITERVYNQFMNVHLISGTAPDIAAAGQTRLIQGNAIAKFYTPLSDFINDPNPYNADPYLTNDMPEDVREFLQTAAWRETFIDGMEGGFNSDLNDYFSIPVSSWGAVRMFFNMSLVREGKELIRKALSSNPRPQWIQRKLMNSAGPGDWAVLPENERLHNWLAHDGVPDTLGQYLLLLEAIYQISLHPDRRFLVGMSASNYEINNATRIYQDAFLNDAGDALDLLGTGNNTAPELWVAHEKGMWSFLDPAFRDFYEFMQRMTRFYPTGWLGLDREQAQRRFVLGNALSFTSGGWDASGVIRSVAERTDAFEIEIIRPPIPAEDEIYAEYLRFHNSEAAQRVGVPLAINRQSRNFDFALDFLKFLSSKRINEELNARAGWVPGIIGAEIIEHMQPFAPQVEGFPNPRAIILQWTSGSIGSEYRGIKPMLLNNEITLEEFNSRINLVASHPRLGMPDIWFRAWQGSNDRSRDMNRGMSIEMARAFITGDERALERFPVMLFNTLTIDEGHDWRRLNFQLFDGRPFPIRN